MMESMFLVTAVKILLFLVLVLVSYYLWRAVQGIEPMNQIREKMDDMDRKRRESKEKGEQGLNWLQKYMNRLDERLTQAGLKKYLPKAGAEIYFLFNVIEFTVIFSLMKEGILVPLFAASVAVYLNHVLLDILRFLNKKRVERHLLEFMNLVNDYSLSESEITMIFYKSGKMIPNPLGDLLVQTHILARNSGDTETALYELRRSVDHFLFQEIILLLELCSKSDSNYHKVVNGCREMVNRYLKEEKEKASVVRGLIMEAFIMTLVAVYGIATMLSEFASGIVTSGSMSDFFLHEPVGQVTLLIYTGLAAAMIQVIIKFAKR